VFYVSYHFFIPINYDKFENFFQYTLRIKEIDTSIHFCHHNVIHYELSSNAILRNGIFVIGKPNEISPPIFIQIEIEYIIVSGNTNEYHPINSPSASKPRPTATKRVADLFPFKYDIIVSIEPYTNKINETARNTYSRETNDTRNSGSTPIDLKYLDLGKKVLIVWENAINQYPIV